MSNTSCMSSSVKIGVIGVGSRGGTFGRHLSASPHVEIRALCDTNSVRLRGAAKAGGMDPGLYATVPDMLSAESLDAVVVTSPDYLHAEHSIAAIERGVHVLVDKPLATTVADCRRILCAAEQARRTVMIGFNLRHHPVLRRLKEIVDAGTLGKVFLMENREFYDGGRTYMSRWNRRYKWSGGLWVHKGCHDFDVFQWLLGFPRPVRVSATAGINVFTPEGLPFPIRKDVPAGPTCSTCAYRELCPDRYAIADGPKWGEEARKEDGYAKDLCLYLSDKDVHDNGISIVEYDNGARASHLECFVTSLEDRHYTLIGDRATADVSLHDRRIRICPRWSKEVILHEIPNVEGDHGGADPALVDAFLRVVREGEKNISTAEHGLWSTAVGQAAELSSREHRSVALAELMEAHETPVQPNE